MPEWNRRDVRDVLAEVLDTPDSDLNAWALRVAVLRVACELRELRELLGLAPLLMHPDNPPPMTTPDLAAVRDALERLDVGDGVVRCADGVPVDLGHPRAVTNEPHGYDPNPELRGLCRRCGNPVNHPLHG